MGNYTGRSFDGRVVAGEFVDHNDADGRAPGTYVTIRLDDPKAGLVGGPARITYLPLNASHAYAIAATSGVTQSPASSRNTPSTEGCRHPEGRGHDAGETDTAEGGNAS
jgi:hypothetical protein